MRVSPDSVFAVVTSGGFGGGGLSNMRLLFVGDHLAEVGDVVLDAFDLFGPGRRGHLCRGRWRRTRVRPRLGLRGRGRVSAGGWGRAWVEIITGTPYCYTFAHCVSGK